MAPKDEQELRDMLYTAIEYKKGPIAIRYPRGNAVGVPMRQEFRSIPIGTGETLRKGNDVAILTIGTVTNDAMAAAEELAKDGIEAEVVHMRFAKPLDRRRKSISNKDFRIITLASTALFVKGPAVPREGAPPEEIKKTDSRVDRKIGQHYNILREPF